MRRVTVTALLLAAGLAAGCGTTDLLGTEVDAQKDRVDTVIKDPAGAADRALQEELRRRGVDGQAPPIVP